MHKKRGESKIETHPVSLLSGGDFVVLGCRGRRAPEHEDQRGGSDILGSNSQQAGLRSQQPQCRRTAARRGGAQFEGERWRSLGRERGREI